MMTADRITKWSTLAWWSASRRSLDGSPGAAHGGRANLREFDGHAECSSPPTSPEAALAADRRGDHRLARPRCRHLNHPGEQTRCGPQPAGYYQAMAAKPVTPGNGVNLSPFITPMRPPPAVSLVPIAILPVELTQYRDMPVGALPSKWTRPVT
jgi:hypothetical protein